ncbi:hypothetical protein [Pseudodesulfovibrio sp. zrk46]|uniref:DUF6901 family protein n=1 Tax=Pseudodesulfovibrio sp. zrk46 TaxID=2725288 RepID=UPI001449012E|nr:hypothetical protein [Pseudodesulfovibrio sp. zrk46]QJB57188.1 hypothetical protein HFN16_12575 [Pseudodesulfovibrio sp. zrk46]
MRFLYRFELSDKTISFKVNIDEHTGLAKKKPETLLPQWVLLKTHQCRHCPYSHDEIRYCPLAEAIHPTIDPFLKIKSYEEATVKVSTRERMFGLRTTVQRGLGSLLGLLIATSGCPHTSFLKPMARFHLPFASEEETLYRAVSTFMLGKFIQSRDTGCTIPDLDELKAAYGELEIVNSHVASRLRKMTADDASINALIILDFFAKSVPLIIEDDLGELPTLFS